MGRAIYSTGFFSTGFFGTTFCTVGGVGNGATFSNVLLGISFTGYAFTVANDMKIFGWREDPATHLLSA